MSIKAAAKQRLAELLVEAEGFKDLEHPVILTSGELGIYYCNTEKLLFDNGAWEQHGDNSLDMIRYCIRHMNEEPRYREVIHTVAEDVSDIAKYAHIPRGKSPIISGGQRRDWIFSGPMADCLSLQHISLYKDSRKTIIRPSIVERGEYQEVPVDGANDIYSIKWYWPIHICDLLTIGSSVYDPRNNPPTGWVPMLRAEGAEIKKLRAVVSRKQGGEGILEKADISAKSYISIDKKFLQAFSKYPDRAVEYLRDPTAWAEQYLKAQGIDTLLSTFDPAGKKKDRALKFVGVYREFLEKSNLLKDLKAKVERDYGYSIE